jgi:hypothetical protein
MIREAQAPTFQATIYIAGELSEIRKICREWCLRGACVSVIPCSFIYTAGLEEGAAINFINYPRFPKESNEIFIQALDLAKILIEGLSQASCTVVGTEQTVFLQKEGLKK